MSSMKIEYDEEVDACYIGLQDIPVDHTKEISDWVYIDYAIDNSIVGIEILFGGKPEIAFM